MTHEEAINLLRRVIKPGTAVYTSVNYRRIMRGIDSISLFIVLNGSIHRIDAVASVAGLGRPSRSIRGIEAPTGGAKDLVEALARAVFPDGYFCGPQNRSSCPSHDHRMGEERSRTLVHRDREHAITHRLL